MRRIVTFFAVFIIGVFCVLVVRETAAVVALARDIHPVVGQVTLWGLLLVYAVGVGVPVILLLRLPRPLLPPASESDPHFAPYLARLAARLSRNPYLHGVAITPDRAGVDGALKLLEGRANEEIEQQAKLVFLSTALSQSGRLDGLFVLVVQARLIWRIAYIYRQRGTVGEILRLYANVGATVFAAQSVEDLVVAELVEPLIPPLFEAASVGATVVLAPVASIVADCLLQGTVNSLLTLRVGCIAKRYNSGLPLPEAKIVRKAATREAASMLSRVVAELSGDITKKIGEAVLQVVSGKMRSAASHIGGPVWTAVHEAVKKVAWRDR